MEGMLMAGGVSLDEARLLKEWRRDGFQSVWLGFTWASKRKRLANEVISVALDAANSFGMETENGNFGEGPSFSEVGASIFIKRPGGPAELIAWLHVLSTALEAAGCEGRLDLLKSARLPDWTNMRRAPQQLATYASYDVVRHRPPRGHFFWNANRTDTMRIAEALLDFCRLPEAEMSITQGHGQLAVQDLSVAQLAAVIAAENVGDLVFASAKEGLLTRGHYAPNAACSYLVWSDDQPWSTRLARCVRALSQLSDITLCGIVQYSTWTGGAWTGLQSGLPRIPRLHEMYIRYNPELLRDYVPDARGVMLLGSSHLQKANDLTAWRIEARAEGKFLLTHQDLEAWYAKPDVDEQLLRQAREDLGDMILTSEWAEAYENVREPD